MERCPRLGCQEVEPETAGFLGKQFLESGKHVCTGSLNRAGRDMV